jgi:hypothetical protein
MPIYFNSVRLTVYSFAILKFQAIKIFRNQHINCLQMKFHYRYIVWISGRRHGLVPFHGLWWLSWITLLAFGQIWWYKVVQVSLWLARLCRYVNTLEKNETVDFKFIPWFDEFWNFQLQAVCLILFKIIFLYCCMSATYV